MTIGSERVRVDFNVDDMSEVDEFKAGTALIIDKLQPIVDLGGEHGRCAAIAQTNYELAAMWAVKAVTGKRN